MESRNLTKGYFIKITFILYATVYYRHYLKSPMQEKILHLYLAVVGKRSQTLSE